MVYHAINSTHMKNPCQFRVRFSPEMTGIFFESLTINFPANKERLQQLLFSWLPRPEHRWYYVFLRMFS